MYIRVNIAFELVYTAFCMNCARTLNNTLCYLCTQSSSLLLYVCDCVCTCTWLWTVPSLFPHRRAATSTIHSHSTVTTILRVSRYREASGPSITTPTSVGTSSPLQPLMLPPRQGTRVGPWLTVPSTAHPARQGAREGKTNGLGIGYRNELVWMCAPLKFLSSENFHVHVYGISLLVLTCWNQTFCVLYKHNIT